MSNGLGTDPVPGMGNVSNCGINADITPANACLRVLNGPGAGRVFPLNNMRTVVGRNDPPAISVDIDLTECELGERFAVSRRHAEIQWVSGGLQIIDVGSVNGTEINGVEIKSSEQGQVSASRDLKVGDKIRFADVETEVATLG